MKRALSVLFVSYPLILHLAIYLGHPAWGLAWLACLLLVSASLANTAAVRWLKLAGAIIVALLAWRAPQTAVVVVPLSIYLLLFGLFATSLKPGRPALISRIAALIRGVEVSELSNRVRHYTRRLTWFWAGLSLLLAVTSLFLFLYLPLPRWSLFSNVISYIIIALALLLEYALRNYFLTDEMDYSFRDFVGRVQALDFSRLLRKG